MFRSIPVVLGLAGLCGSAQAQQSQIEIDLSGVAIEFPYNDQVRDSVNNPADGTAETIILSDGYRFSIEGNVRVTVFFIPFYEGPVGPLFNFLEPGLGNVLSGWVRNASDGLPPADGSTWRETFAGGFAGAEVEVSMELTVAPDGRVTFRAFDLSNDLGALMSIEFTEGTGVLENWTPSAPQTTEWHFNGDFASADGSDEAALRYLDEAEFGDILVGEDADATPDPTIPKDVTEAQSSFVDTAAVPGVPSINGEDDVVYLTSPAFNLSDPNNANWRRGLGLACFPSTMPEYPNPFVGQWTLVYDMLIPASSWFEDFPTNTQPRQFLAALLQTDADNDAGADIWLRRQGGQPGVIFSKDGQDFTQGFVPLPIAPDTWFRLAIVGDEFQRGISRVYLDGVFVGETGSEWVAAATDPGTPAYSDGELVNPPDWTMWGMFPSPWSRSSGAMNPDADGNPLPAPMNSTFCLFADSLFGGSQPVYLANLLFTEALLSDTEVGDLGGPAAAGILLTDSGGCNGADLAEPFGTLDFSDVIAFLGAFGAMQAPADLAPPTGVFDFSDVVAFLTEFGAGCP